jgi:hypothetical protein
MQCVCRSALGNPLAVRWSCITLLYNDLCRDAMAVPAETGRLSHRSDCHETRTLLHENVETAGRVTRNG